jgi:hypothetical protein
VSWDARLAEPIALKRGQTRFQTLGDAARFLQRRYGKARSGALAGALSDLISAAEDPSKDNLVRATDQFLAFLAQEGLVDGKPRQAEASTDLEARMRAMLEGRPLSPAARAVRQVARAARRKRPTR